MRLILSILLLSLVGNTALAKAMSTQRSRCFALERVQKSHSVWKLEFRRFQNDDRLSLAQKFDVAMRTAPQVLNRLKTIQEIAQNQNNNRALISDMTRFLKAMEDDAYTPEFAIKLLGHALPKFEETIDHALLYAEVENQCLDENMAHKSTAPRASR